MVDQFLVFGGDHFLILSVCNHVRILKIIKKHFRTKKRSLVDCRVTLGKNLGFWYCFGIGRYFISSIVNEILSGFSIWTTIVSAMEEDKYWMLFWVRLSYLPHFVQTYGLSAINQVDFFAFAIVSFCVSSIYSMTFAWIGSQVNDIDKWDWRRTVLAIAGVLALIVFGYYAKRLADKKTQNGHKQTNKQAKIPFFEKKRKTCVFCCSRSRGMEDETTQLLPGEDQEQDVEHEPVVA